MTIDELAAKMDEQFNGLAERFDRLEGRTDSLEARMDQRFEGIERKMDQGFNDSKTRDERLEGLMTFGLEAREVLRDEMHRRFDRTDQKNDEQITRLKDAVQHLNTRK